MMKAVIFIVGFFMLSACGASARIFPECIDDFCLGKTSPKERDVLGRYGGYSKSSAGHDGVSYCYRFSGGGTQQTYGLFVFREIDGKSRLVTVRASVRAICTDPIPTSEPITLFEGLSFGDKKAKVIRKFGKPRYMVENPSNDIRRAFFGPENTDASGALMQYTDADPQSLLYSIFFLDTSDNVIGVEVSIDE